MVQMSPLATFSKTIPIAGMRPDTAAIAILTCPLDAGSNVTQRTPEIVSEQVNLSTTTFRAYVMMAPEAVWPELTAPLESANWLTCPLAIAPLVTDPLAR
jgi:hypothetical protein